MEGRREEFVKQQKEAIQKFVQHQNKLYPAKTFSKEEALIRNTVQQLVQELSQPPGQKSVIPPVSLENLEDMIQCGHLNLIAESLPDSFLTDIENMIKNSDIIFSYRDTDNILSATSLKDLYEETALKHELQPVGDHLIRMYTNEGPFFRKLNAILGNYNNEAETTAIEKKASLLMNIALAKASLEKRKNELQQQAPDVLYRGQCYFPIDEIHKKLVAVQKNASAGTLSNLNPEEINSLDVSTYFAAKRFVSSTTNLERAKIFAEGADRKNPGVVWHIHNLESMTSGIADIDNTSESRGEREFTFRLRDDVMMIPVNAYKDNENFTHIEVECMRRPRLVEELSQYDKLFTQAINKIDAVLSSMPIVRTDSMQRRAHLLDNLRTVINNFQSKKIDSNSFQDQSTQLLIQLVASLKDPGKIPKKYIDIQRIVEEITAASSGLKLRHDESDTQKLIAEEQQKLAYHVHGKKQWLNEIERQSCGFITVAESGDLDYVLNKIVGEKASAYALHKDKLYYIRELPREIKEINYPPDKKEEIKKLFPALPPYKTYVLDLGNDEKRQTISTLTGYVIKLDKVTADMKELIAKFPAEFATITDINAPYSAVRQAANKIIHSDNVPDSLLKGLKDILTSLDKLESENTEHYKEKIAQKDTVVLHQTAQLMKSMKFEGQRIKLVETHRANISGNYKNQPITSIQLEIEVDALTKLAGKLHEDAIEVIMPEQAQHEKQWVKVQPKEKKPQPEKDEGQKSESTRLAQFEKRTPTVRSEKRIVPAKKEVGLSQPEKWVITKPEKPKMMVKIRVEYIIKKDTEEIMKKANDIVKDLKTKVHPEINEKTQVLDSILFEFSSSKVRDLFKERIARAEETVYSSKLAKDIDEQGECFLRVNAEFIRDNTKLVEAIIKEIDSPQIIKSSSEKGLESSPHIEKLGFFKTVPSQNIQQRSVLLGTTKGQPTKEQPKPEDGTPETPPSPH